MNNVSIAQLIANNPMPQQGVRGIANIDTMQGVFKQLLNGASGMQLLNLTTDVTKNAQDGEATVDQDALNDLLDVLTTDDVSEDAGIQSQWMVLLPVELQTQVQQQLQNGASLKEVISSLPQSAQLSFVSAHVEKMVNNSEWIKQATEFLQSANMLDIQQGKLTESNIAELFSKLAQTVKTNTKDNTKATENSIVIVKNSGTSTENTDPTVKATETASGYTKSEDVKKMLEQLLGKPLTTENSIATSTESSTDIDEQGIDSTAKVEIGKDSMPLMNANQRTETITLSEAPKTVVNKQFVQQFTEIMQSSKFTTTSTGTQQLIIRLNPDNLGSITVKLVHENGEMTAKIIASSTSAKELIESNLQQIRHVIPTQNIVVEKFDVLTQQPQSQQPNFQKEQQRPQEQDVKENKDEEENTSAFDDVLEEETINFKV